MKKESFTSSLPFKLLVALAIGIGVGLALSAMDGSALTTALLNIIVTVKFIVSQFINFCVPLIIIGFIAPSITRLGNNASRMLIVALCIAYISSIGAALFNIAANALFIRWCGYIAAAYTTLGSYIIFVLANLRTMRSILGARGIKDNAIDYRGLLMLFLR